MKLQLCAEIEGQFLLKEKVTAKFFPYEFVLFSRGEKRYISVTKPVKDYVGYTPKVFFKDGLVHIEATNPEIYKDLEDWLYYIEALGSFDFEVSKIHIDELEVNWICENDEEMGLIPITSLKRKRQEREAEKYVTENNLSNIVIFRRMLPEAHIPFSYYRQAKAFFDDNNYYFAFINFFMMLEFCFAGGKFLKKDITNNFKKSNLLKLCVLSAISMIKANELSGNYSWLLSECKSREKEVNYEGIIYILVEYRGLLSHASERSKAYLFNDSKLRPLAFITSMICFLLSGYIQVYSCSNEESKNQMMLERINKLKIELGWN